MKTKNALVLVATVSMTMFSCKETQTYETLQVYDCNGVKLSEDDTLMESKTDTLEEDEMAYATALPLEFDNTQCSMYSEIHTTLDKNIQDTATSILMEQLQTIDANWGTAIVMETETGNVKAMVNLKKAESELMLDNYAMHYRLEPGSTFKTASIMVALEDGFITPETMVDTGNGIYMMYGASMKDWSYGGRGGFGLIDVKTVLEQSSNIGVARLIDENYHADPGRFIKGLERVGMSVPLDIPFATYTQPRIKTGSDDPTWSETSLPWLSIGYESLLAPLHVCTFYNGIANGGRLISPRLVSAVKEKGKDMEELPVKVVREQMCSEKTLRQIHDMLENVVSATNGTGKKARCEGFKVCGKTGTAQMAAGQYDYHEENTEYYISFCGYFPADAPKYTCFVGIQKTGLPASGGGHCGPVFKQIAEYVYTLAYSADNDEQ